MITVMLRMKLTRRHGPTFGTRWAPCDCHLWSNRLTTFTMLRLIWMLIFVALITNNNGDGKIGRGLGGMFDNNVKIVDLRQSTDE